MGTLNAIYIRASEPSVIAAVRTAYPTAYTEPGSQFFAVDQPVDHFRCPDSELRNLSARLNTDVIWLSFQSAVDAFQYHHWNKGEEVRSLVYGCFKNEREWEEARGQPQAWEATILFGDLASALKYLHTEKDRRAIEHIYRNHLIEPGAGDPGLDSRETARGVAEFFRFPGWSLAM